MGLSWNENILSIGRSLTKTDGNDSDQGTSGTRVSAGTECDEGAL